MVIMAGCTVFVVLFVTAMNLLLLKAGGMQCRGSKVDPTCRHLIDDITVMTKSLQGTDWFLRSLEKMATLSQIKFNPGKS